LYCCYVCRCERFSVLDPPAQRDEGEIERPRRSVAGRIRARSGNRPEAGTLLHVHYTLAVLFSFFKLYSKKNQNQETTT
jgi:hypothetical protein